MENFTGDSNQWYKCNDEVFDETVIVFPDGINDKNIGCTIQTIWQAVSDEIWYVPITNPGSFMVNETG
ncbi:hypothetical protein [Prevotella sp. tc2-28]|uniref:hypothetical protein n=1 Tax=Prevotella sp. tc2-28 TaxID=1761888 RepID=UPI00115FCAD3|nr:hypothetical protein [Prevotella sp. tc2-28]